MRSIKKDKNQGEVSPLFVIIIDKIAMILFKSNITHPKKKTGTRVERTKHSGMVVSRTDYNDAHPGEPGEI